MRVVLDTNVLLYGLAYPASLPGRILAAWKAGALEVVLSDGILEELRRVLLRLQSRHGLSEAEMNDLVDCLSFEAEIVPPDPALEPLLTDPWDQAVLGTWRAAQAEAPTVTLITGDRVLVGLGQQVPCVRSCCFLGAAWGLNWSGFVNDHFGLNEAPDFWFIREPLICLIRH
jgi:putative PIN family toxin of toxin-antitoxin system